MRDSNFVDFCVLVWRQWEAILSREETSTTFKVGAILLQCVEKLAKNDSSRPNVHLFTIVLLHEDELGGAVKPSGHMARHLPIKFLSQLASLLQDLADLHAIKFADVYRVFLHRRRRLHRCVLLRRDIIANRSHIQFQIGTL